MLALCFNAFVSYYAQNYAGIIRQGLEGGETISSGGECFPHHPPPLNETLHMSEKCMRHVSRAHHIQHLYCKFLLSGVHVDGDTLAATAVHSDIIHYQR